MTQQLFDDSIGQPPPSTVDVAGIVRRQKRNRRLRGVPLGLIALVAVAATVAFAGFGRPGPADPGQAAPPSDSLRFRLVVDNAAAKKLSGEQLSRAYDAAVRAAVPGARWSAGHRPVVTDQEAAPPTEFIFSSGLLVGGRKGELVIQVAGPPSDVPCKHTPAQCAFMRRAMGQPTDMLGCKNPDGHCLVRKGPHGEELTVRQWKWSAENVYTSVAIALPHQRVLTLESQNSLLTVDQVSRIVTTLAGRIEP